MNSNLSGWLIKKVVLYSGFRVCYDDMAVREMDGRGYYLYYGHGYSNPALVTGGSEIKI